MIVDVNVYLSRWPFRRVPCDERPRLVERLQKWGVGQAWVGSFDGLFHRDVGGVNARLADDCARAPKGLLVPFGTVNPMLPDWQEDLRRCHEQYRMPGIRLHPNYHGYTLADPEAESLLAAAAERGLIVQLVSRMDDTRTQHRLMQIADVDLKPLPDLMARLPRLRLVLLNALRPARAVLPFLKFDKVSIDIAVLEGVGGLERLLSETKFPVQRVLFGSHLPLFNLESAVLKLRESELTPEQYAAITETNARRLLKP